MQKLPKLAIIGAGPTGLVLAERLQHAYRVTVFEKARGVAGRMSTRYADPYQFDHGAQYFTARHPAFREWLQPFINQGLIAQWRPNLVSLKPGATPVEQTGSEPRYVPVPRMNALCQQLAQGLDVRLQHPVTAITHGWRLAGPEGRDYGDYDWVVLTCPARQTSALLPEQVGFAQDLLKVKMTGCFSLMLGFAQAPNLPWQAALVQDSPIGWLAVNNSKPGRDHAFSLLVQSTNGWAEQHLDDDPATVQALLIQAMHDLTGIDLSQVSQQALQRWRYAAVARPLEQDHLIDFDLKIAAAGDWCIKGRVEAAFLSAVSLAQKLCQG